MSGQNDTATLTCTAGEAMSAPYLRVYISALTAGAPATASLAGVNAQDDIGVTRSVAASGDKIGVTLYGKQGTQLFTASGAVTAGALIYPAASGKVSATAVGEPLGIALEAASGNGAVFEALTFPKARGPRKITDPGNAGAIPVTHSGTCSLTTGGSGETRTCAAPTFDGQKLVLCLDVDGGGDAVITFASDIGASGENVATLADVADTIVLEAVRVAGVLRWVIVGNFGSVVLS